MKRCDLFKKSIENGDFENQDNLLGHLKCCSDCSFDKMNYDKAMALLKASPEPSYPENLHSLCCESAFENKSEGLNLDYISDFFYKLLFPLEIAVPAACLVMMFVFVQLNNPNEEYAANSAALPKLANSASRSAVSPKTNIDDVSAEEVKEFLAKLDEFNRKHPANSSVNDFSAEIQLVGDK